MEQLLGIALLSPVCSDMHMCCAVADVQYLLLHSNMFAWLGAVVGAERPNKPLCAVLFFILGPICCCLALGLV